MSALLVKGVHLVVGVRGARIADRARSVYAGASDTKSVCVGAPISTGSSRRQIYGEEAKGGSSTDAYAREKAAALFAGVSDASNGESVSCFRRYRPDLFCGVRSGVRHCRSASVLLFMVRSSPRALGDGADPTASDELTLCGWHLAGERNCRVLARSLRGVLAEAQEPPG